jgi:hypothetical protein
MVNRSLKGIPIRIFKEFLFAVPSSMPDRPYRMDDIFAWQIIGTR